MSEGVGGIVRATFRLFPSASWDDLFAKPSLKCLSCFRTLKSFARSEGAIRRNFAARRARLSS